MTAWYASGGGIARIGPYPTRARARAALRLAPRVGRPARPRIVPTRGWFAVVEQAAQHEIGTDCYPADLRVWCES